MRRLAVAALWSTAACAPEWVVWHGHTTDHERAVRVVERGGRQQVVVGGRDMGFHAAIGVESLAMAGSHLAYPARDGLAWRIYVDGVAEPGGWESVGPVALTASGAHAYAGLRGGQWFVVASGAESGPYGGVSAVGFDGRGRAVWVAKTGASWRVVRDGVASEAWLAVRDVHFEPVLRYVASDEHGERYVREGRASPPFESIEEATDDGFVAKTNTGRLAYAFDEEIAQGEVHLLATAAGHFALARLDRGGERIVRDGVEDGTSWQSIDSMSLSEDGRHVGWVGHRGADAVVVVDGRLQGSYAWARAPVFAARAETFVYVASMGAGALVRGPGVRAAFDLLIEDSLVITPDGAHWGAVGGYASNRRLYVLSDGRPRKTFDLDEWIAERMRSSARDDGERLRELVRAEVTRCYAPRP